jgi:hypothetical protein
MWVTSKIDVAHFVYGKRAGQYARGVLLYSAADAAPGLVRANLYSNWRAANRGSNPSHLVDDMLHVL